MKITKVSTHLLTSRWNGDSFSPPNLHACALVRVETDKGIEGYGEATVGYFAPEIVAPLVNFFQPVLIGRNPFQIAQLSQAMLDEAVFWARSGAGRSVIAAIETALWDIKGKVLGVPVYELLGGRARDEIPVYASGGPALWPLDQNVRKVQAYIEKGQRTVKFSTDFYRHDLSHEGGGTRRYVPVSLPHADLIAQLVKNIELIRRECGTDIDLAIDGHQGGVPSPIAVSEAMQIAQALGPFRLRFYEEPLAYTDLSGYRELRRASPMPIAGGESLCGLDQFSHLVSDRSVDLVQPDLGFVGGVLETVRIIHHAQAVNIHTALHTGASIGPAFAASWHVAAACASVDWLEYLVSAAPVQAQMLKDPLQIVQGKIGLPASPGLGLSITPEMLVKYPYIPGSGERT